MRDTAALSSVVLMSTSEAGQNRTRPRARGTGVADGAAARRTGRIEQPRPPVRDVVIAHQRPPSELELNTERDERRQRRSRAARAAAEAGGMVSLMAALLCSTGQIAVDGAA